MIHPGTCDVASQQLQRHPKLSLAVTQQERWHNDDCRCGIQNTKLEVLSLAYNNNHAHASLANLMKIVEAAAATAKWR
jgi:hypothetical protein